MFDMDNLARQRLRAPGAATKPGCTSSWCAPATRSPRPWSSCSAACRRATSSSRSTASSNQDDLPQFEAILKRVDDVGLKGWTKPRPDQLLALPFKLIAARHRLGLIDEGFEARVIEARRHFADNLPEALESAIEFFDPARYNGAATLQDNILFGKIVTGQAGAVERITELVREMLDELGLRPRW